MAKQLICLLFDIDEVKDLVAEFFASSIIKNIKNIKNEIRSGNLADSIPNLRTCSALDIIDIIYNNKKIINDVIKSDNVEMVIVVIEDPITKIKKYFNFTAAGE